MTGEREKSWTQKSAPSYAVNFVVTYAGNSVVIYARLEGGCRIYQIVSTLYKGIFESFVIIAKLFSIDMAIKSLSNGSL